MYFKILLLIHIAGAILGIGPTTVFGILGKRAEEAGPNGGLALLRGISSIERTLVTPVALVTQPVTGVLLIFQTGRQYDFFSYAWLWVAILIYIVVLVLSYGVSNPNVHKMMKILEADEMDMNAFEAAKRKVKMLGPVLGLMTIAIIVLMVLKPGE